MNPDEAEFPLNPEQLADIHHLYSAHPILRAGRNAFVNMLLKCVPKITLKSMPFAITEELNMLMKFKWRKFGENVYDRLKMHGICPWYRVPVPKTVHSYPEVPVIGSGSTVTYLNKKGHQQFKWYDNSQKNTSTKSERKDMMWWQGDELSLPTKEGVVRSEISTLLMDWRTRRIMIDSMEIAQHHAARPQHIFE